jgi:hypothetical protein
MGKDGAMKSWGGKFDMKITESNNRRLIRVVRGLYESAKGSRIRDDTTFTSVLP